jgi:hypothetical protein
MVLIGHQLKRIQLNLMDLERLVQNSLERVEVGILVKDRYLKISTVPCVIQSACFISAGWSGHADAQGLRNALESLWRFTDQRGLTPLISPFTLPQGGSLRRNDEAGRATSSARWRRMVRDGWS